MDGWLNRAHPTFQALVEHERVCRAVYTRVEMENSRRRFPDDRAQNAAWVTYAAATAATKAWHLSHHTSVNPVW